MFSFPVRFLFVLGALHCMPGCLTSEKSIPQFDIKSINMSDDTVPAIVLGGGVAGLTAALYLAQANIPCLVIEGAKPGGALAQSHSVRNWPGKFDVPGADIIKEIKQQVAVKNDVKIFQEEAIEVNFDQWPYSVKTKNLVDDRVIERKVLTCIIAMGAEPRYLGISGETGPDGYWGRGVSNCAVCEGSLYKDKDVAIVGGGDAAVVEAEYLSNIARSVKILIRKDHFKAKDVKARDRVLNKSNVEILFNTQVKEIKGDKQKVSGLVVENNVTKEIEHLPVQGLFLAIGSIPRTSIFRNKLQLHDSEFIVLKQAQETSRPRVYAAGDVCDDVFVQAVTSAGHGCMAAIQAKKFLDSVGFEPELRAQPRDSTEEIDESEGLTRAAGSRPRPPGIRDIPRLTIRAEYPTVVKLYSQLCIPCQRMEPIFKDLEKKYEETVKFVEIDVANPPAPLKEIQKMLNSDSITVLPTFLFIKEAKEVSRLVGLRHSVELEREIQKIMKK